MVGSRRRSSDHGGKIVAGASIFLRELPYKMPHSAKNTTVSCAQFMQAARSELNRASAWINRASA
jgi:hypothetical protein